MPNIPGMPMNRISMGQQARLPDLPKLPLVGSDMHRMRQSALARTEQSNREMLLKSLLERRKRNKARPGQNAVQAQAAFLTGKVRNRLGTGPNQDLRGLQSSMRAMTQSIA